MRRLSLFLSIFFLIFFVIIFIFIDFGLFYDVKIIPTTRENASSFDDFSIYNNKSDEVSDNKESDSYIAFLEIPRIGLKKGLVSPLSSFNNVANNIEIIYPYEMPDVDGSTFILAAHSGNLDVSFFRNLRDLELNDLVYVYYNDERFVYRIIRYYEEKRTGYISIKKGENKNVIVLTTCKNKREQLIYIGTLIKRDEYSGNW